MSDRQTSAERCHVLKDLVLELGGLAHEHMTLADLDSVIDNILSKGLPTNLSDNLARWIHTHRKLPDFKIAQILGAHVSTTSLVSECFGRFWDGHSPECKACLDTNVCKGRCKRKGSDDVPVPEERVTQQYPVGKPADSDTILEVLKNKAGQIARTLSHGNKVFLVVSKHNLQVLAVDNTNNETLQEIPMGAKGKNVKEDTKSKKNLVEDDDDEEEVTPVKAKASVKGKDTTAKKTKAAPAPEPEEDEDEDIDMEDMDDEEEEDEDEEEEAPKAKKVPAKPVKKAAKPAQEEEEDEEEDEEETPKAKKAAEKPAKKAKKEKAPMTKEQQLFQDELDKRTGEDKWKYSKEIAKKMGIKIDEKPDEKINHMLRCMAIKKKLAEKAKK